MKRGGFLKRTPFNRKTPPKPMKRGPWRNPKPKVSKLPKPKIWTLKRADKEFSLYIRERDGRCMYPNCDVTDINKLQCSHYIGRAHKATRFDPDNCIALCWLHHFKDKLLGFEYQKQIKTIHGFDGQYTIFMQNLLGFDRFAALVARGASIYPQSRSIVDCMVLVNSYRSTLQ